MASNNRDKPVLHALEHKSKTEWKRCINLLPPEVLLALTAIEYDLKTTHSRAKKSVREAVKLEVLDGSFKGRKLSSLSEQERAKFDKSFKQKCQKVIKDLDSACNDLIWERRREVVLSERVGLSTVGDDIDEENLSGGFSDAFTRELAQKLTVGPSGGKLGQLINLIGTILNLDMVTICAVRSRPSDPDQDLWKAYSLTVSDCPWEITSAVIGIVTQVLCRRVCKEFLANSGTFDEEMMQRYSSFVESVKKSVEIGLRNGPESPPDSPEQSN